MNSEAKVFVPRFIRNFLIYKNAKSEDNLDEMHGDTFTGPADGNKEELVGTKTDNNDSVKKDDTIKAETFKDDDEPTTDRVELDVDTGKKSSHPSPLPAAVQTPREGAPLETLNIRLPQLMTVKSSEWDYQFIFFLFFLPFGFVLVFEGASVGLGVVTSTISSVSSSSTFKIMGCFVFTLFTVLSSWVP